MRKEEKSRVIIIILSIVIVVLMMALLFFCFKDEICEEVWDQKQEKEAITNTDNNNNNQTTDNNTTSDKRLTREEALKVALDDLKIEEKDIFDSSIELENKFNTTVYEIDFHHDRYEYEYYVDAKTGKIIKSFQERD